MAIIFTQSGVALPNPASYSVVCIDGDSDNTLRDDEWNLHREVVRKGMWQIDVSWKVSQTDLKKIHDIISVTKVPLKFYNPCVGGFTSANMYSSDRKAGCLIMLDDSHPEKSQWEYSTSLTIY